MSKKVSACVQDHFAPLTDPDDAKSSFALCVFLRGQTPLPPHRLGRGLVRPAHFGARVAVEARLVSPGGLARPANANGLIAVVVIGSVNTDMVVKGSRLPAPGETVTGGRFVMAAGGKGANQTVAAARLGAEVTLVAKVGRDIFGDQAIGNFRREGILTDRILCDPEKPTGLALILVDDVSENLISVASGTNHALSPPDVDQVADCIRSANVLMLQLEIPIDTVRVAARMAAQAGVPVILDPAPAMPLPDNLW